ncbi:MAG: hypothetical protein PHI13_02940 [Methylococcales bacterium]|nr:hypothetical protein [Methylococcales bacterium]
MRLFHPELNFAGAGYAREISTIAVFAASFAGMPRSCDSDAMALECDGVF